MMIWWVVFWLEVSVWCAICQQPMQLWTQNETGRLIVREQLAAPSKEPSVQQQPFERQMWFSWWKQPQCETLVKTTFLRNLFGSPLKKICPENQRHHKTWWNLSGTLVETLGGTFRGTYQRGPRSASAPKKQRVWEQFCYGWRLQSISSIFLIPLHM